MTLISRSLVLFSLACLSSLQAHAGDRIGNGAGVWACQNSGGEVFDIKFMDIFEAEREYKLKVPERTEPFLDLVQAQKAWIHTHLSVGEKVLPHIEYVEKNLTWVDDVINLIPDGANKMTPHPSTCRQGRWEPVQLVNFTEDFRILIRRDLFESAFMSSVEKAAVFMHEGIYSYLRTEYGDTTSVRTRAIVGFLFSDFSDDEKIQHIQKVLGQSSEVPPPSTPQAKGWICGVKPDLFSALFIFEAMNQQAARDGALAACRKEEGNFGIPGMPFIPGMPNIPGMPGANPGGVTGPGETPGFPGMPFIPTAPTRCKESAVLCEQILTSEPTHVCEMKRFASQETEYSGQGRTLLEARKNALASCMATEANESCYSTSRDLVCH